MNDDVINMIRIQYAINSVYDIVNASGFKDNDNVVFNLTNQYKEDLHLPLTETVEGTNRPRAINGDYVRKIFDDVASKTGIYLGTNTYKRVMGILNSDGNFSPNTHRCIMSYLGIKGISWEEFLNVSSSYRQQKWDALNNMVGCTSRLGAPQTPVSHVHLPLLEQYDLVILSMGKDVKTNVDMQVKLECLDKGKFKVIDSRGLQLKVDDIIYTDSTLLKGNMLAFYRVKRGNREIPYVGSHPIKRIELRRLTAEEILHKKCLPKT